MKKKTQKLQINYKKETMDYFLGIKITTAGNSRLTNKPCYFIYVCTNIIIFNILAIVFSGLGPLAEIKT